MPASMPCPIGRGPASGVQRPKTSRKSRFPSGPEGQRLSNHFHRVTGYPEFMDVAGAVFQQGVAFQ